MGYERRFNAAMQFQDRDRFIAFMNEGQPVRPANIAKIVDINQGTASMTMGNPQPPALDADAFGRLRDDGCLIIDGRNSALFGGGHVPGAYNIAVASPEFEQRVGWVLPLDADLLLVVASDAEAAVAAHKMAFVGLDHRLKGFLAGGMQAWAQAGNAASTVSQASVHELDARLAADNELLVLDVREPEEFQLGHIAGAVNMSFKVLGQRLDELQLDRQQAIAVVCAGGVRSSTACSVLLRHDFGNLANVAGGMGAWRAAGLPTVS